MLCEYEVHHLFLPLLLLAESADRVKLCLQVNFHHLVILESLFEFVEFILWDKLREVIEQENR